MFFQTSLIRATKDDNLTLATRLIASGVDVNQRDWSGMTALMYAVWFCREDICRFLINAGANLNAQTNKGRSALDIAYMVEARRSSDVSEAILRLLLTHGASDDGTVSRSLTTQPPANGNATTADRTDPSGAKCVSTPGVSGAKLGDASVASDATR